MPLPVLLITGPVGVGKTSVAGEIGNLLMGHGVPHAVVDLDALSEFFPRPPNDRFGTAVALHNLSAIWPNFATAGADRLVLATVVESQEDLDAIRASLPDPEILVIRLRAPVPVLQERVRQRELGSGLDWHVARAAELSAQFDRFPLDHITVETNGRTVQEIAHEIVIRAGWLP